jgi:hypothetical protein
MPFKPKLPEMSGEPIAYLHEDWFEFAGTNMSLGDGGIYFCAIIHQQADGSLQRDPVKLAKQLHIYRCGKGNIGAWLDRWFEKLKDAATVTDATWCIKLVPKPPLEAGDHA